MKFYALKHVASGEFMPEVKGSRGYSHWEPGKTQLKRARKDSIRLFSSTRAADLAIYQWSRGITRAHADGDGEYLEIRDAGRKLEDLKRVSFTLVEDEP